MRIPGGRNANGSRAVVSVMKIGANDLGARSVACGAKFQWMDGMAWRESANREGWFGRWHVSRGFIDSDGYSADMEPERPVPITSDVGTVACILSMATEAWTRHWTGAPPIVVVEPVGSGWRWRLFEVIPNAQGGLVIPARFGDHIPDNFGDVVESYAEACVAALESAPGQQGADA